MKSQKRGAIDLFTNNFIEYASYVIRDRAIPEFTDGLKPVQRRILYSLFQLDDSKFHKVANVIGHTMQYHPHGDAAIGDALVVLANKNYFIDKQGNFGNLLTGDSASAARYIECRLTPLAKEVLYNKEITEYSPSYDGRKNEPIVFPCKIPYILLHGAEGIAVGMSTKILPNNFNEVLEAQIAYINKEEFKLYPDFHGGGIIDITEYNDGLGKVKVRALIEKKNHKTLIIKEIPYGTTSDKLISSIEDAIRKNKVKASSIQDFTTDHIEIEVSTQRGVTSDEILERLYAYTDCETQLHSNINLIVAGMPKNICITEILKNSTDNLINILKAELKLKINKLKDKLHKKTLEQIFIEKKLYKNIETSETYELAIQRVTKDLKPYTKNLIREILNEDVEALLEIPIKRISKFDIIKNTEEIKELNKSIKLEENHLLGIKKYTISFLKNLIKKYGAQYPRRTKIKNFETVNARDLKDSDTKVYYDRSTGYIGTKVKGDSKIECSSFDKIVLLSRSGSLKIIPVNEKTFCDKLVYFGIVNKDLTFNIISRDKKSNHSYVKRFKIGGFIQNKEYTFLDPEHRLECFSIRENILFEVEYERKFQDKPSIEQFLFEDFPIRGPQNRATKIGSRKILKTVIKSSNTSSSNDVKE